MFMIFSFDRYYPRGGMNDWRSTFSDMKDFKPLTINPDYDVYQIFDTFNGNKSELDLYRKVQELDDIEPLQWDEEIELRRELIYKFVENFVEGE